MLALEAHRMGLEVHIFSESSSDPAAQVTSLHHQGSLQDSGQLVAFAQSVDVLTFESEWANLEGLASASKVGVQIHPQPSALTAIRDRAQQKAQLDLARVATANWMMVHELGFSERELFQKFPKGFVLKSRIGGYDGKGTFFITKSRDLSRVPKSSGPWIAEEKISFRKEVALCLVRSRSGHFVQLPLVESKQVQGRCDWVIGPLAPIQGLAQITTRLRKMMESLNYIGVLAVEMFVDGKNIWVNELAPRVHNSGHYSQTALSVSQFEYHLRALLDWPLPQPNLLSPSFAMINWIGTQSTTATHWIPPKTGELHWYGKTETRPGRKMAHVNYTGESMKKLLALGLKERRRCKI